MIYMRQHVVQAFKDAYDTGDLEKAMKHIPWYRIYERHELKKVMRLLETAQEDMDGIENIPFIPLCYECRSYSAWQSVICFLSKVKVDQEDVPAYMK